MPWSDEAVEAAVGAWMDLSVRHPRDAMRAALEAAEAVREREVAKTIEPKPYDDRPEWELRTGLREEDLP